MYLPVAVTTIFLLLWSHLENCAAQDDEDCINAYSSDSSCDRWATMNECDRNPVWMVANCRKACRSCSIYGCTDRNTRCKAWSEDLECRKNPGYMNINCPQSCGRCIIDATTTLAPTIATTEGPAVQEATELPASTRHQPGDVINRATRDAEKNRDFLSTNPIDQVTPVTSELINNEEITVTDKPEAPTQVAVEMTTSDEVKPMGMETTEETKEVVPITTTPSSEPLTQTPIKIKPTTAPEKVEPQETTEEEKETTVITTTKIAPVKVKPGKTTVDEKEMPAITTMLPSLKSSRQTTAGIVSTETVENVKPVESTVETFSSKPSTVASVQKSTKSVKVVKPPETTVATVTYEPSTQARVEIKETEAHVDVQTSGTQKPTITTTKSPLSTQTPRDEIISSKTPGEAETKEATVITEEATSSTTTTGTTSLPAKPVENMSTRVPTEPIRTTEKPVVITTIAEVSTPVPVHQESTARTTKRESEIMTSSKQVEDTRTEAQETSRVFPKTTASPVNTSPSEPEPQIAGLYLTNETHVLVFDGMSFTTVYHSARGNIVGLAEDIWQGYLFWSDNAVHSKGIYRSNLDGSNIQRIIDKDIFEVNGLSVDWIGKQIYWTDAQRRRIEAADYDGANRRVVINSDLLIPRGIVLDLQYGNLYWNDQGTRRLERSRLDGTQRETVLEAPDVHLPNQMVISQSNKKLYWVDAGDKTLKSTDLENPGSATVVARFLEHVGNNPIYGLTVSGDVAYVSTWGSTKLLTVILTSGEISLASEGLGQEVLFSLSYADRRVQPYVSHPCNTEERGGCSHSCLPKGGEQYNCACPSFGGLALGSNGKTCQAPAELLLYARADTGEVGFVDISDSDVIQPTTYLVGYSSRPVSVAYDPLTQQVYWGDVQERSIHRAFLNGTKHEIFMNASHGLGYVEGLAVDWMNRKLYFTNTDFVTIDGIAFTWHKIEVIGLDGEERRSLITDLEQPRGLWLDLRNKYMYYTDWGQDAKVVRTQLDGSDPVTVAGGGMDNPNAAIAQGEWVYMVDSHYKSREAILPIDVKSGGLYSARVNDKKWHHISAADLETPFGLTSLGSNIYISDWGKEAIIMYNVIKGTSKVLIYGLLEPMGMFATRRTATLPNNFYGCTSDVCDLVCIASREKEVQCGCPSYGTTVLQGDGRTCEVAENFVLVADMTSIRMMGLDSPDRHLYTVLETSKYMSSIVALAYDGHSQKIYFSDVNRGNIYEMQLPDGDPVLLYAVDDAVESMVFDKDSGMLYWTAQEQGTIFSLNLRDSNSTQQIVVSGLSKPKALTLNTATRTLYWTEAGATPRVAGRSLRPSDDIFEITRRVEKPNGIYWDDVTNQVYVLDSEAKQILVCSNGDCRTSHAIEGDGPFFGLVVMGDFIYYGDWGSRAIYAQNSNRKEILAGDLMRPTQFVVHNTRNITDNCANAPCEEECLPLIGSYWCSCQIGSLLAEDQRACLPQLITTVLPAEATSNQTIPMEVTTEVPLHRQVTTVKGDKEHLSSTPKYLESTGTHKQEKLTTDAWVTVGVTTQAEGKSGLAGIQSAATDIVHGTTAQTTILQPHGTDNIPDQTTIQPTVGIVTTGISQNQTSEQPLPLPSDMPRDITLFEVENVTEKISEETVTQMSTEKATISTKSDTTEQVRTEEVTKAATPRVTPAPRVTTAPRVSSTPTTTTQTRTPTTTKVIIATTTTATTTTATTTPTTTSPSTTRQITTGSTTPETTTTASTTTTQTTQKTTPLATTTQTTQKTTPLATTTQTTKRTTPLPTTTQTTMRTTATPTTESTVITTTSTTTESTTPLSVTTSSVVLTATSTISTTVQPQMPSLEFIFCPMNRTIQIQDVKQNTEVWWPEPAIRGGALNAQVKITQNIKSGSSLPVGETVVRYTAEDTAGGNAVCSFSVFVKETELNCPDSPISNGGQLDCYAENLVDICRVKCADGYVPMPLYNTSHVCRTTGWDPPFPAGFEAMSCLKSEAEQTEVKVNINFEGLCRDDDPEFNRGFKVAALNKMVEEQKCRVAHVYLCHPGRYDLQCGVNTRNRGTRQTTRLHLIFTYWIPPEMDPQKKAELQKEIDRILRLYFIQETVEVKFRNNPYRIIAVTSVIIGETCPPGSAPHNRKCLMCPAGAKFDEANSVCVPCPQDTYQNLPGQTFCHTCPADAEKSELATYSVDRCFTVATPPTTEAPETPNNWSVTIIVIVSIAGALVFLIALVLAFVAVKRVLRKRYRGEMMLQHKQNMARNGKLAPHVFYNPAQVARPEDNAQGQKIAAPQYIDFRRQPTTPDGKPRHYQYYAPSIHTNSTEPARRVVQPQSRARPAPYKRHPAPQARKYEMKEINRERSPVATATVPGSGKYKKNQPGHTGWSSLTPMDKTTQ